ncbi:phosphotransferase family protein [Rothia nasimurium]|uniref:phosphotransferase family protein n=1 Tax=Rothia nasimurium TaxID=85336 RepID=UPI003BA2529E
MAAHLAQLEQMKALPVVTAVMDQAGLSIPQDRWDIRTTGSAHLIVNMGAELSVRVAKTQKTGHLVARRTEILRRLPYNLPFEVPRPITRVITRNGYTAVGLTWIKGEPRLQGAAPPKQLASLLKAIHDIDYGGYGPYLDMVHEHWGGRENWDDYLKSQVIPLLLRNAQKVALAAVDRVLALEPVEPCLVHGDLAGHNILWNGDKIVGVIDWDHASVGDPAIDHASLGNYYGWDSLAKALTDEQLNRAKIVARLLPLQSLAYTMRNGMGGAIERLAIERADEWYLDHREEILD